jgi:hypothetical protein
VEGTLRFFRCSLTEGTTTMIPSHPAQRQAKGKFSRGRDNSQSEPSGYLARSDRQLKQERLNKLTAAIARTAPPWATHAPWVVELILERGMEMRTQRRLFDGGAE